MNITNFEHRSDWWDIFKKQRAFSQYIRNGGTVDVTVNGRKKTSVLILKYKKSRMFTIWMKVAFPTVCSQIKKFQVGLLKDANKT